MILSDEDVRCQSSVVTSAHLTDRYYTIEGVWGFQRWRDKRGRQEDEKWELSRARGWMTSLQLVFDAFKLLFTDMDLVFRKKNWQDWQYQVGHLTCHLMTVAWLRVTDQGRLCEIIALAISGCMVNPNCQAQRCPTVAEIRPAKSWMYCDNILRATWKLAVELS